MFSAQKFFLYFSSRRFFWIYRAVFFFFFSLFFFFLLFFHSFYLVRSFLVVRSGPFHDNIHVYVSVMLMLHFHLISRSPYRLQPFPIEYFFTGSHFAFCANWMLFRFGWKEGILFSSLSMLRCSCVKFILSFVSD